MRRILARRILALRILALLLALPLALACTDGADCTCDLSDMNCICAAGSSQATG